MRPEAGGPVEAMRLAADSTLSLALRVPEARPGLSGLCALPAPTHGPYRNSLLRLIGRCALRALPPTPEAGGRVWLSTVRYLTQPLEAMRLAADTLSLVLRVPEA